MAEQNQESLKGQVALLPDKPGVYQYLDQNGIVIYVGKAKNLKKRVASYFTKQHDSAKTRILVRRIHQIRHIVVGTETDALLLENNLIKKYKPRYNVLLKDDKSFPWIVIKNEPYPRVFSTRNVRKDGSLYFGPYTHTRMMRTLLNLVREMYPLRTCKYALTEDNIAKGKFKVCLEYHIGNCKGPCEGLQEKHEYDEYIEQIKKILRGNIRSVLQILKQRMQEYAGNFQFEEAQLLKERIGALQKYQSKSTIVSAKIHDVDVFSLVDDSEYAYVNFIKVANGAVIQSHTVEMKRKLEESREELLVHALINIRDRFESQSHEIIIPFELDLALEGIQFTLPKRGDKLELLKLSERNAKYFREERKLQLMKTDPERHQKRILETAKQDLHLKTLPGHIECFDNSNIQGANPVAACVVFRDTKPSKKEYRHFNIKTVEGPDDYASMYEVVSRRYKRLQDEGHTLPDLVVIDGGKGQLGAARRALEDLQLEGNIPLIGIAKRLEEIYYPGDDVPLYLDKNSETLKLIQHLRDEAHRFGIRFHRNKRSSSMIESELQQIDGIGDSTVKKLFQHFKSLSKMKQAPEEKLAEVIGKAKAKIVYKHFLSN